jgi:hypothetical protein
MGPSGLSREFEMEVTTSSIVGLRRMMKSGALDCTWSRISQNLKLASSEIY